MAGPVIGVVGGSGGVGASSFAAVLAGMPGRATLVDLDAAGGGIDVLLGIEDVPGCRWSGLRVGGGRLDPDVLAGGLPRWDRVAVLAADCAPDPPGAVTQVLDAAAALGRVVIDLGRGVAAYRDAAVRCCSLVVVLAVAEVPGLSAARAVSAGLPGAPAGLVLRRGSVPTQEAAVLTALPLIGVLPASRDRRVDARRAPRAVARTAAGVLDGVQS